MAVAAFDRLSRRDRPAGPVLAQTNWQADADLDYFPLLRRLFSLLIYFIGYKLRAGESEWNELHLVDVLASGEKAELRGRTYTAVYSPANQRYDLESKQNTPLPRRVCRHVGADNRVRKPP